jgi:membrane protease YdiL (CAAX protease family)
MTVRQALRASGLIIVSLAVIVLCYFALEPLTDFLSERDYPVLSILSNLSLAVIIYFFVRWFNKKVHGLTIRDYGIGSRRLPLFFLMGVFASILLAGTTLIYFFVTGKIDFVELSDGQAFIGFLLGNLVVASWEEMYFRGLVVTTLLKGNMSFIWTAIISSALFAILHVFSFDLATITPFWLLGVFFISTILLLLYIVTRSIWTSIGCHFCWDSLFGSLEAAENDFGLIHMSTYTQDEVLIDNLSILVTGVFLLSFLILTRNRIKSWVQAYLLPITVASR